MRCSPPPYANFVSSWSSSPSSTCLNISINHFCRDHCSTFIHFAYIAQFIFSPLMSINLSSKAQWHQCRRNTMLPMYKHPWSFNFFYEHRVLTKNITITIIIGTNPKYLTTSIVIKSLGTWTCFGLMPFKQTLYFFTNSLCAMGPPLPTSKNSTYKGTAQNLKVLN